MKRNPPLLVLLALGAALPMLGCGGSQGAGVGSSSPASTNTPRAARPTGQGQPAPTATDADRASTEATLGGPDDFDAILKKYVQGDYFDYRGLKSNPEDLARFEAFMRWQAEADLSSMSREEQIAFYINAYNACSIKAVLDHYPVHTPMDIDGFFDKLKFKVAGEELTLGGDQGTSMEYDRLIANYKDMRAHFAVVCADRGCLPLKAGAYRGSTLDKDLEAAAKHFVTDERHFKVDPAKKEVSISKIFEWYGPKFLNDPDRPVEGDRPERYLVHWVDGETRELLESGDYQLKIIEWDWTLNEKAN